MVRGEKIRHTCVLVCLCAKDESSFASDRSAPGGTPLVTRLPTPDRSQPGTKDDDDDRESREIVSRMQVFVLLLFLLLSLLFFPLHACR